MRSRKYISYVLAGLMVIFQIVLILRVWSVHNLSVLHWTQASSFIALAAMLAIDPLAKHTPKMTRTGYIKFCLLSIALLLAGYNIGRAF